MKIVFLSHPERLDRFCDLTDIPKGVELVLIGPNYTSAEVIAKAADAEGIIVDAVLPVDAEMIAGMPNLKLIHSEGVGYALIDTAAATKRGIYVCNNSGVNAGQVAEHAVMLMLTVLRRYAEGEMMVRAGRQMEAKTAFIMDGIGDLIGKKVGLIGFGAIGKELAKRLLPFGCEISYYTRHRVDAVTESAYQARYLPLEELLCESDIVSLQIPATPETQHIIRRETLSLMKPTSILINCARGSCVNSADLAEAIKNGTIYGCGLDTMDPEPVPADDPVLLLPEPWRWRVAVSPHIAGTTLSVFQSTYLRIWANFVRLQNGEKPINIVNVL